MEREVVFTHSTGNTEKVKWVTKKILISLRFRIFISGWRPLK